MTTARGALTLVMAALIGQDILALFGISIGSFATVILHAEHADGLDGALAIGVVILLMCGALLVAPCAAGRLPSLPGATGINVLTRLMGMILAASAVKMMAGGLVDMFPQLRPAGG